MKIAQSSHIQAHDYDPANRVLMIQFTNGAIYHYQAVSQTTYDSFSQSSSPGEYFHSKIRERHKGSLIVPGDKQKRRA
jgi:hypothetical protein